MMKTGVFALLLVACYVECKKTYAPLDKHANVDFINMEGGGIRPAPRPGVVTPPPQLQPAAPKPISNQAPVQPTIKPAPVTSKPQPPVTPPQPKPQPVVTLPPKTPTLIRPIPVNPAPVANPITTPGPGNVKDLVNFYNSQGKGSPIRPYSYSQAVKQG